ncbi:MAG: hypothetical protein V1744_05545 [Candidatus Altiarchaeota archaeon]
MEYPSPIITEENIQRWVSQLNWAREKKHYLWIALMHLFLKDLGAPVQVTKQDKELMRKGLRERRKFQQQIFPDPLASVLNLTRSVGLKVLLSAQDESIMRNELARWRDIGDGERVAWNIYSSRMLGVRVELTDWDKNIIRRKLEQYRTWDLSYPKKFRGMRLAEMHFLMLAIGLKPRLTASDCNHINWFIRNWKTIKHAKINVAGAEANWYLQKIRTLNQRV